MASIPELALAKAMHLKLDLSVHRWMVPADSFHFQCLEPKPAMLDAFHRARAENLPWVEEMPLPVLVYHEGRHEFRIMDGMMRICSAQQAQIPEIPALVASGETYDELEHILNQGYYGEDFIEMLAMVNPIISENLKLRDRNRSSI